MYEAMPMRAATQAFDLTSDIRAVAEECASHYGVRPDLDDRDHIFGYSIHQLRVEPDHATRGYFGGGRSDAEHVKTLVARLGLSERPFRLLEFASGYGRVTRHLKVILPNVSVTASDIHPEAVSFIRDRLGVEAVASHKEPASANIGSGYDLIVVLSLFSHLPERMFGAWLRKLTSALSPDGFLMFTTHGDATIQKYPHLTALLDRNLGYGFSEDSDQRDIDTSDYGTAIVRPSYVARQIEESTDATLISFTSSNWFGLQDEWIIQRPKRSD
jgi:SAM-dependent methyltransferase